MSKIYLVKKEKLKNALNNLQFENVEEQIKLKKVYYKIHNLLKELFPTDLANLINEYITDIIDFKLLIKVYLATIDNYELHIHVAISTENMYINYEPYTFQFDYYINIENELTYYRMSHGNTDIYSTKSFITSLIPFFNCYLQYVYGRSNLFKEYSKRAREWFMYETFILKNNQLKCSIEGAYWISEYNMDIKNQKKFKNMIMMLYVIVRTLNKLFIKYENKYELDDFYKIHKPRNINVYFNKFTLQT